MNTQQQRRFRLAGLTAALAAVTLAAAPAFADEAAVEGTRDSMQTFTTTSQAMPEINVVVIEQSAAPLTREQVRDELREARAAGTVAGTGEAGDTPEILAARERYNAAQYDKLMSEAIDRQNAAFATAELDRFQRESEELLAVLSMPVEPGGEQYGDVQIDFISMEAP